MQPCRKKYVMEAGLRDLWPHPISCLLSLASSVWRKKCDEQVPCSCHLLPGLPKSAPTSPGAPCLVGHSSEEQGGRMNTPKETEKRLKLLLTQVSRMRFYGYECMAAWMSVPYVCSVPMEGRRGRWILWDWRNRCLLATLKMLRIKPKPLEQLVLCHLS